MQLSMEFDPVNSVLLIRLSGPLTDDSVTDVAEAVRKYSATTEARGFITDVTSVSEFSVSTEFLRRLAKQEPAVAEIAAQTNIIVASQTHAFGLARMFQTLGEHTRPHLQVVRCLEEALRVLGIKSSHFEPFA